MKNDFGTWLQGQLDERGWRQADLARASVLSTASIAQFVNNQVSPGSRGCEKIARAFGIPEETVFRAAGILKPATDDPWADEQSKRLAQITDPTLRAWAERLIDTVIEQSDVDERARTLKTKAATK